MEVNKVASKVVLNGKVLIDLTQDTALEETVVSPNTFHKSDGTSSVGQAILGKPIEVQTSAEMDEILANATEAHVGSCYKFIGETDAKYEANALYIITKS